MKKSMTVLSILSASIILAGCGKTSTSDNTAPKKNSEKTTTAITEAGAETTTSSDAAVTTAAATVTEAGNDASAANVEQGTAGSNAQNNGIQEADVTTASDTGSQGSAFAGRLNQGYQGNYQNEITRYVNEAASSGGTLYIDYALKDVTGDGTPELILKHGQYEMDSVITVYNSDLKVIGDMFRGSYTGFYENSSGALAFATAHMGYFYVTYPEYDAASDQLTVANSKDKSYDSADEIAVLLQEEGLTALDFVSISVSGGSVKSYYGSQEFDYPYFGIIV